jgi:hypothetical protein
LSSDNARGGFLPGASRRKYGKSPQPGEGCGLLLLKREKKKRKREEREEIFIRNPIVRITRNHVRTVNENEKNCEHWLKN